MVPAWCDTDTLKHYWNHPETVPLSRFKARRFKRRLWQHGYVTPHFGKREAMCHDGTLVPRRLRGACQRQGFHMERVRHRIGRGIPILSWYRTRPYNASIGGASESQHLLARACDIDKGFISSVGAGKWNDTVRDIFANGGIGIDHATGFCIHMDSRRGAARWYY